MVEAQETTHAAETAEPTGSAEEERARRPRLRAPDFRDAGFWIAVLVVLLVLLNAAALVLYAAAHPDEGFAEALWGYAESDTAKMITASLILPLLVFVVEGRFNVTETVRASRIERARRAQDERREARLETLGNTSASWRDLFALATTLSSPDSDAAALSGVRAQLWNAPATFGELIGQWRARFPNLERVETFVPSYLILVNTFLESAASALFHIRSAEDEAVRADVRGSIDLIAAGIDTALQFVQDILNDSLELMEIVESHGVEELRMAASEVESAELSATYEAKIAGSAGNLHAWAEVVRAHLVGRPMLASAEGPGVDDFRERWLTLADEIRSGRSSLEDSSVQNDVRTLYSAIPRDQRLHAWSVKFTPAWLAGLADELLLNNLLAELADPNLTPSS
jgi:hypothetical protein